MRHGWYRTPTYNTWRGMKERCLNPNSNKYHLYGGKGITVCERWLSSFTAFLEDMGERPEGMTIDRKNGQQGYNPDNCHWATISEQNSNRKAKTHCKYGHEYAIVGRAKNTACLLCKKLSGHARYMHTRVLSGQRRTIYPMLVPA